MEFFIEFIKNIFQPLILAVQAYKVEVIAFLVFMGIIVLSYFKK